MHFVKGITFGISLVSSLDNVTDDILQLSQDTSLTSLISYSGVYV